MPHIGIGFFMAKELEYGAATHIGLVRSNNEDCYLAEPSIGLWLIADGMGGHDAGEVASNIVKESVYQSVKDGLSLSQAILQSHTDVKKAAEMDIGSSNMGTTVVALQNSGDEYEVAWVGDSRAYLWTPLHSTFEQISKDHSYVQALFDAGSITAEEMENHPQKNVITQSLGIAELDTVTVDSIKHKWQTQQKIILCSDGLSDLVNDQQIKEIIQKNRNKDDQTLVSNLINEALKQGGVDNVTVQVISAPDKVSNQATTPIGFNKTTLVAAAACMLLAAFITAVLF